MDALYMRIFVWGWEEFIHSRSWFSQFLQCLSGQTWLNRIFCNDVFSLFVSASPTHVFSYLHSMFENMLYINLFSCIVFFWKFNPYVCIETMLPWTAIRMDEWMDKWMGKCMGFPITSPSQQVCASSPVIFYLILMLHRHTEPIMVFEVSGYVFCGLAASSVFVWKRHQRTCYSG